ncbi:MAG: hypothetical protein HOW73_30340 [Polyangiaceae bacterium]|nr:hypothetical protein [Polyangiaceae bacterium]
MSGAARWLSVLGLAVAVHAAPPAVAAIHRRLTTLDGELEARFDAGDVRGAMHERDVLRYLKISSREDVARARALLVDEARAHRAAGDLDLGGFLLRAAALDGYERGLPIDPLRAEAAYRDRVARLEYEVQLGGADIVSLMRKVFGDLDYHGNGGSIADVLLSGGGSCEGLTHLLAAAMYDAKLREHSFVRRWGAGTTPHVAPIYRLGVAIDLLSGGRAKGGVEFPAPDLIEVYARHHGLAPRDPSRAASEEHLEEAHELPTMAQGYPANDEVYPGLVPLYAGQAIASVDPGTTGDDGYKPSPAVEQTIKDLGLPDEFDDDVSTCGFVGVFGRTSRATALVPDGAMEIEIEAALDELQLAGLLRSTARLEKRRSKDPVRALAQEACLSWSYDLAARQLSYARKPRLATEAASRSKRARDAAIELERSITWNEEQYLALLKVLYIEPLVRIPAVADRLMSACERAATEEASIVPNPAVYYRTLALTSLLQEPSTQERVLSLVPKLSIEHRLILASEIASKTDFAVTLPTGSDLALAMRSLKALSYANVHSEDELIAAVEARGMPKTWVEELRAWAKKRKDALHGPVGVRP